MAATKPDEHMTQCGICKETINAPKALPCLHTFCLECLREWSKTSRESAICPILACKKTTPMPSDGVDGLPGNVFVSSLIERRQLGTSREEICKIEPVYTPQDIAKLHVFKANHQIIKDISQIEILVTKVSAAEWVLESEFDDKDGPWKLPDARGISITPAGDIAVANYHSSTPVKVYSRDGQFKFNLDKQSPYAWNVAVSSAGQFYVTTGVCKYVTVYGTDGRHLSQFATVSPSGMSSDAQNMVLMRGLAINDKEQVLVGEYKKKYISIHDLNGVHITSIRVNIDPDYIVTTPQGNIIVSPNRRGTGVQILDSKGTLQQTINAPVGVSGWHPRGVCCSINDEICISNCGEPEGIYCFSSAGVYLGCITKKTNGPYGVALMQNDGKLVVIEGGSCVIIFRRK